MITSFETERLIIRKFTLADAVPALEMNLDPEVTKYLPMEKSTNLNDIEESIKNNTLADYENMALVVWLSP